MEEATQEEVNEAIRDLEQGEEAADEIIVAESRRL